MTFAIADRVIQTTVTAGTGPFNLDDPDTGYVSIVDGIGDGMQSSFLIDDGSGNWEIVLATVTAGNPDTLAIDSVLRNSAGTQALISFDANEKTIALINPADLAIQLAEVPTYADGQILQRVDGQWEPVTPDSSSTAPATKAYIDALAAGNLAL